MNFKLDHVDPQEGLDAAISETITKFLVDVSSRLAPMRVQFDSLDFEDVDDDGETERLLKAFAQQVWGGEPHEELLAVVSANLIVIGGTEANMSTDFLVYLKLSETDQLEVEIRSPVGFIVYQGDIAAVYARQITQELISKNMCAASQQQK
jgi:hypothetical protein